MAGLSSSGRKKVAPSLLKFTAGPAATRPAPTRPPVKACVVEMGKPVCVASITVAAAPSATQARNAADAEISSGTSPVPEKFLTSSCAKKIEQIAPAAVQIVAHQMALR